MEQQEIEAVEAWISKGRVSKRKTVNRAITSYGLKHMVEKEMGVYVSNESLMQTFVLLGFTPHPVQGSPNCYFNIKINTRS